MNRLEQEIPSFARLDENLYRGGQPSEAGLHALKEFGVKTIINFRHEPQEIAWERALAAELGFNFISLPWRIQIHPNTPVMREYLDALTAAAGQKVFVHCRRGAERTGVADAIYRHYVLKQDKEAAFAAATDGYSVKWIWRPFIHKRFLQFSEDMGTPQ